MGPNLSAYEAAAKSIYAPQQKAEAATLGTEEKNTINTLEGGKAQIQTDYQAAIDNLNSVLNKDVGKINQLYSERLGGNFSGLQGNDLGGLFASAQKQQSTIEQTRANKLSSIAIEEANAQNKYGTDIANLPSKYQALEAESATKRYDAATKQASTDYFKQQNLDISRARLGMEQTKAAQAKQPSLAQNKLGFAQKVAATLSKVTGRDGFISPQSYQQAKKAWVQAGYSASEFDTQFSNFRNPSNKNYSVSESPATYVANSGQ